VDLLRFPVLTTSISQFGHLHGDLLLSLYKAKLHVWSSCPNNSHFLLTFGYKHICLKMCNLGTSTQIYEFMIFPLNRLQISSFSKYQTSYHYHLFHDLLICSGLFFSIFKFLVPFVLWCMNGNWINWINSDSGHCLPAWGLRNWD
jgi:hypothetical protein